MLSIEVIYFRSIFYLKFGNILNVDSFLNHQMDIKLFNEMGKEFKRRFEGQKVDILLP